MVPASTSPWLSVSRSAPERLDHLAAEARAVVSHPQQPTPDRQAVTGDSDAVHPAGVVGGRAQAQVIVGDVTAMSLPRWLGLVLMVPRNVWRYRK